MPNLPVLIFDWSGVISDDRLPVYESNMRLMDRHSIPRMKYEDWLPQTRMTPREFFKEKGVENEEELFEQHRKNLDDIYKEGLRPFIYPEVKNILEKLFQSGKKLAVVSSHPESTLHAEAREYGLEKYFSFFIGSVKDKTEAILDVCKKAEIAPSPQTVAYTGDSIYDIQAAKKAGVYSVGITTGYHTKENLASQNPDKMIDSLSELL